MNTETLETALGHTFTNRALLEEALTHSTWLKEAQDKGQAAGLRDQQRLEFLGDAFLSYTVGVHVFQQDPEANEGTLTARRTARVKGAFIQALGEELQLNGLVRLGRGETKLLDRNNKVCEDTVEALVGAVLLDGGNEAAQALVQRLFLSREVEVRTIPDWITQYTHRWQKELKTTAPKASYERVDGTDEAPVWRAVVALPNGRFVEAQGGSKREARSEACRMALDAWDEAK